MKIDKSPGSDQMHPRILWEAKEGIAGGLAGIYQIYD